jgi:hypothetical protein
MNGTGGIIRITWHNCDEAGSMESEVLRLQSVAEIFGRPHPPA